MGSAAALRSSFLVLGLFLALLSVHWLLKQNDRAPNWVSLEYPNSLNSPNSTQITNDFTQSTQTQTKPNPNLSRLNTNLTQTNPNLSGVNPNSTQPSQESTQTQPKPLSTRPKPNPLGLQINKPVKLLILAYPRTGSSFIGEILVTSEDTAYVYEPFHQITLFGHPVDLVSTWNKSVENYVENYLNNLFNCDNETLTELQTHPFYFKAKNMDQECVNTTKRVIKTIRLHSANLDPWITESDIRIVHLVRDPRAIFNSMKKQPDTWGGSINHMDIFCQKMYNDTFLATSVPQDRYVLLKYEDLLTAPVSTLFKLFSQLNMEFDLKAADSIFNHTRAISQGTDKKRAVNGEPPLFDVNYYYSTYRTADADIHKWRKELSKEEVKKIEKKCRRFMRKVEYKNVNK